MNPRRRRLLTAASTFGGAALFAVVVWRTGAAEIAGSIQRVGWGLAAVIALQGIRLALRTVSWRLCLPRGAGLAFPRAFAAFVAGDAMGNVTPLGLLASEPTKVFLTRHHLATADSVASLAVENLVYAASVAAVVMAGLLLVLALAPLSDAWRWAAAAALLAVAAGAAAAWWLLRRPWPGAGSAGEAPAAWAARLGQVRLAVLRFTDTHAARLGRAFGVDMAFHAVAVVEAFLTLGWLMGDRSPTLVQAIAFEALNRVVTVAFKFVPFRVGVDEAISGAAAPLLAVDPATGVALALVRKVRNLCWSAIGLAVIARHPAEAPRARPRETEAAPPL